MTRNCHSTTSDQEQAKKKNALMERNSQMFWVDAKGPSNVTLVSI